MSQPIQILAFAGSSRQESVNRKVLEIAAEGARDAGAQVTVVDLGQYSLPLYNADLETAEGLPENAKKLKTLFKAHQGLLIASPEYNSSFTPLLKNTIDWVSRSDGDEGMLACYKNKVAALISASPGQLGGLRGLSHLRPLLENMGVMVIPNQVAVSGAYEAFDESGKLKASRQHEGVKAVGAHLAQVLQKLQ